MNTVSLSHLRDNLGKTVKRVTQEKTRTVVTRHGNPVAAIVPIEELEHLDDVDDERDSVDLTKERDSDDGYRISFEDLLKEIG